MNIDRELDEVARKRSYEHPAIIKASRNEVIEGQGWLRWLREAEMATCTHMHMHVAESEGYIHADCSHCGYGTTQRTYC